MTGPTGSAGANGVSSGLVLFFDTAGGAAPQVGTLLVAESTGQAQTTITYAHTQNSAENNVLVGTFVSAAGALTSTTILAGDWDVTLYAIATTATPGNGLAS